MPSEYRLTGQLEAGELAELYRAQRDGAASVVVKLFHEKTSAKGYAQAIADTSNRLQAVNHPGICHVIDVGVVHKRLAIVREDTGKYTLGQVLQRLNTKEVVITSGLAMALIVDLLDAVNEAHGLGIVHGAMTPGNVLVSAEGRPAVCDFGALAALNSVAALKKNFAGRGRSAYRAPELIKGDPLTVQSDVYSLGAMTYELLTLREAAGESAQMSTRREALPPPSRLDRRLNSRIDPIVMRALDPVPGRRFKTTGEFSASLREYLTANGGMPAREELKRFVDQLFPADIQMPASTVVPFADAFALVNVEGADVDPAEDRSVVLTPRASFSGSLDDFPAIQLREEREGDTGPNDGVTPAAHDAERERSTDWHAPVGAMPATARSGPKETMNADVLKRVRRIEDFEPKQPSIEDTLPTGEPIPKPFPGRGEEPPLENKMPAVVEVARRGSREHTSMPSPADSQPISVENSIVGPDGKRRRMITEERNLQAADRARQKWIPIVAGCALLAVGFLAIGTWRWSAGLAIQPYEPPANERPRPWPVKRPVPVQPRPDPKPDPRPVVDECYPGPKKGAQVGYLSVSSTRPVAVVIDGDTVCGSYAKIPITAGQRKVVVIDTRTKEEYVSPTRIEQGKLSRLIPIFKGK